MDEHIARGCALVALEHRHGDGAVPVSVGQQTVASPHVKTSSRMLRRVPTYRFADVCVKSGPQLVEVVGAVAQCPQEPSALVGEEFQLCAVHVNREADADGQLSFAELAQSNREPRQVRERDVDPGDQHRAASARHHEGQTAAIVSRLDNPFAGPERGPLRRSLSPLGQAFLAHCVT